MSCQAYTNIPVDRVWRQTLSDGTNPNLVSNDYDVMLCKVEERERE